jgi:hypothetical protein
MPAPEDPLSGDVPPAAVTEAMVGLHERGPDLEIDLFMLGAAGEP